MKQLSIEKIISGVLFLSALFVYICTMESTTSLWDCAEYISSTYRLEIGHPPGAPLFALLGSLFTIFASPETVAWRVNLMSAVCGALGVMLVYQLTTHFSKKIFKSGLALSQEETILMHLSGIISSCTLIFLDTYWFNATESELYSMTNLLTILAFWTITRWELAFKNREFYSQKWLVFLFFVIGLAIGVRIMALLVIPAIGLLYYFETKAQEKPTIWKILSVLVMGAGIVILIQFVFVPYFPIWADHIERFFVNDLHLPLHSGVLVFIGLLFVLFAALFYFGYRYQKTTLTWITFCVFVIFMGYLSYALIVIRASTSLPMNQNKPDTMTGLRSFILRERYGKTPFLYGPVFNAPYALKVVNNYPELIQDNGSPSYIKVYEVSVDKKTSNFADYYQALAFSQQNNGTLPLAKYIVENYDPILKTYRNRNVKYHPDWETFFPRIWNSTEKNVEGYRRWSGYDGLSYQEFRRERNRYIQENNLEGYKKYINAGLEMGLFIPLKDINGQYLYEAKGILSVHPRPPKFFEHFRYFLTYQVYWMYLRYFLWNFSGKQINTQGSNDDLYKGQWISGLPWIDSERLGNQWNLPDFISKNPGHNRYFYLPFFFGLIGLIFHWRKRPKDAAVLSLLFLSLGLLLAFFLNMPPEEPRERDYVVVACSLFVFSIWIGMSVLAFWTWSKELKNPNFLKTFLRIFALIGVVLLLEQWRGNGHFLSFSLLYFWTLTLIILMVLYCFKKPRLQIIILAVILSLVPLLLAVENWDDHDRSNRYFTSQLGKAYLASCKANGLIFTQGDNDTFPLWYIQDVEEFRLDLRVLNAGLFEAEWSINPLRTKIHQSEPFELGLSEEKYRSSVRRMVLVEPEDNPYTDKYKNTRIHAKDALKFISSDALFIDSGQGSSEAILPTRKLYINVNKDKALQAGIITQEEWEITPATLEWDLQTDYLTKAGVAFLDLLAHYQWDRPIYFTALSDVLGHAELKKYFRSEKMLHVFTPILNPEINLEENMVFFLNKNGDGLNLKLNEPKVKLDQHVIRSSMFIQMMVITLANQLIEKDQKQEAAELITYTLKHIIPYKIENYVLGVGESLLHLLVKKMAQTQETALFAPINEEFFKIYEQNLMYFVNLEPRFIPFAFADIYEALEHLSQAYLLGTLAQQEIWEDPLKELYQQAYFRLENLELYEASEDANYLAMEIGNRYEKIFGEPIEYP